MSQGAWGTKPKITPDKPGEAEARAARDKAAASQKDVEAKAKQLIGLIYQKIAAQTAGSAANYAGDKQYSVEGRWKPAVVDKAIQIWESTEGIGYHTKTSVKHTGASRIGSTQTNFICKIIGPPTKADHDAMEAASAKGRSDDLMGRHNVHVTHDVERVEV